MTWTDIEYQQDSQPHINLPPNSQALKIKPDKIILSYLRPSIDPSFSRKGDVRLKSTMTDETELLYRIFGANFGVDGCAGMVR